MDEAAAWQHRARLLESELQRTVGERDALQARIDAYEGHLEEWEKIDRLIAESSLGSPEAVAMRAQVHPQLSKVLVRAIQAQERADALEAERDRLQDDLAFERQNAKALQGYTDQALENAINAEAERDRLRTVVDAVRGAFIREPGDETLFINEGVPLVRLADALDQLDVSPEATEEAETERDRLRAVVDAVRVMWDNLDFADPDGRRMAFPVADYNAIEHALVALDVSPDTGGDE